MNIIQSNLQFKPMDYGNHPNAIVLHHAEASRCSINDIHQWHLERGWSGCGYHYLVRKDGSVYAGRPENAIGAHCPGYNDHSIGICAEGEYMSEQMPAVQKAAIVQLCIMMIQRYGIKSVVGHGEVYSTSCPGQNYPLADVKRLALSGQASIAPAPVIANTVSDISVQSFQHLLNAAGYRDSRGRQLVEDGIPGTCTSQAYSRLILRQGSRGDLVKWLQSRLISKGFGVGVYGADGAFGTNTQLAVVAFQKSRGLGADGIVGPMTISQLLN